MKIKTFYAKTMADALQEIKVEMGPDALLLSSKEIRGRSGVNGLTSGFEVVAATDESHGMDSLSLTSAQHSLQGEAGFHPQDQFSEKDLSSSEPAPLLYSPEGLINRPAVEPAKRATGGKSRPRSHPDEPETQPALLPALPFADSVSIGLYQDLISSGVYDWLARKLVGEARTLALPRQRRSRAALLRSVARVAHGLIAAPPSPDGTPIKRVVVFVGPTGVGKTTAMAKLAARLAFQQKKKIVLMTLDSSRIGAVEQLRIYAGLMGIPFRFVRQVADLPNAIQENGQRDFILLDTTGRGPRDLDSMKDLAEFLQASDQVERHLVLSATTKAADIDLIVDRFEVCRPDHLLFTKLDETFTLGPILNELVRTRKSLSYYSDGQRVPDDLHAVTTERIIDLLFNKN